MLIIHGGVAVKSYRYSSSINWILTREEDYVFNPSTQQITAYYGPPGSIIVPDRIGGVPVLGVGPHAFDMADGKGAVVNDVNPLSAIRFPYYLTDIAESVCYGSNVTHVEFGPHLRTVGPHIFGISAAGGDMQDVTDIVIYDNVTFESQWEPMGTWGGAFRAKYAIEGAGIYHWTGTQWDRSDM